MNARLRVLVERLPVFSSHDRRLVAAAALFHIALAAGLFWAGRAQIAPRLLDRNAIMVISDSYEYHRGAIRLAGILKENGFRAWAAEPELTHVKLISIQFVLFSPLFGYSALSAEPFNLFCYVAIVSVVLLLGHEVGGRRVGLLAAGIVAVWPSFLLHTTQLLKDPLFIAAILAVILVVTTWLTRTYNWVGAVGTSALLAVATGLLLLIRAKFVAIIFAFVFFGLVLLIVRQLIEKRLLFWNLICPLLILCAGALTPFYLTIDNRKFKQYPSDQSGLHKSVVSPGIQLRGVVSYPGPDALKPKTPLTYAGRAYAAAEKAALYIGADRYKYNSSFLDSGSAIDRNVEYTNLKGMIAYLPRAVVIGLWAPFPNMWLGAGRSVGRAGRILSGAETLIMYLCEALALLGIWRAPRCLAAWLLLMMSTLGVTVLGLVVSNVGTLYRFRYPFWILLIILGVKGFESIARVLRAGTSCSPERDGELREVAQE